MVRPEVFYSHRLLLYTFSILIVLAPWGCQCSCFGNVTTDCCAGFKTSEVLGYCVPESPGCDKDAARCDAYSACWDAAGEVGVNLDYVDEYSAGIEFCNPETNEFHCSIGYYTGEESRKAGVFCHDNCAPSNPEKSCMLLRTEVCNECDMNNVKDINLWCDVRTKKCKCKDGFYDKSLCTEACPADKAGHNCERDCNRVCEHKNATCFQGQCICYAGSKLENGVCKTCEVGQYGKDCKETCKDRCSYGSPLFGEPPYCDPVDGHCLCKPGRDPEEDCEQECAFGTFSPDGVQKCQSCGCKYGRPCDSATGKCECGQYLAGDYCEKQLAGECPARMWGPNCDQECKCNIPFNCTRSENDKGLVCRCTPNELIDENCRARKTTVSPISISTPGSDMYGGHDPDNHWEWIVMAIVLAAGMVMGVSLIGCYKLCCRTGKYLKPPSGEGEIRYKVKDDVIFVSVKNPRFKKEDPEALVATLFGRPGSVNGPFDQSGYADPYATQPKSLYNRNAPNLHDQMQKNFNTNNPGKATLDKKGPGFVQMPNGKKNVNNQKVLTLPNEYVPIDNASASGSFSGNRSSAAQSVSPSPYGRPSLHFQPGENEGVFRPNQSINLSPNPDLPKLSLNSSPADENYIYGVPEYGSNFEHGNNYREVPETYVGLDQDAGRQKEHLVDFSQPINPMENYSEEPSYTYTQSYSNPAESFNNNRNMLKKF